MNDVELRNKAVELVNRVVPSTAADSSNPLWIGYKVPPGGTSCGRLPQYMVIQLCAHLGVTPPKTQRWLGNGGVNVEFMLHGQIDHRPDAYVKASAGLPGKGDIYWIAGSGALHIGVVLSASQGEWETADSGAEMKGNAPACKISKRVFSGGKLSGEAPQGVKMVPVMGWADITKYFRVSST